jgi:predicted transcriptional regulator
MATPFTTIKVRREVRDRLARIAHERKATMAEVLDQAIGQLERESFFVHMQTELERLRDDDPREWQTYRQESLAWERATVGDGLGPPDETFW